MSLQSELFRNDSKLEAASMLDSAHILRGAIGQHVLKIQSALMILDDADIDASELQQSFYGSSTAACVMAYKEKRNIINYSYQTHADDIVGKMTTLSLDTEMLAKEQAWGNQLCNQQENSTVDPDTLPVIQIYFT